MAKRRMPGSPYRELCANYPLGLFIILAVVPEFDAFVQGTCNEGGGYGAVPIDAVNLGCVSVNGFDRLGRLPGVPNMKPAVMGRGEDIWVLAIVFDLSGAGKPVTKGQHWLPGSPEVPAVNISVHCTSCERVRVVSGEIGIGNGSAVGLERVFNRPRGRIVSLVEVPY